MKPIIRRPVSPAQTPMFPSRLRVLPAPVLAVLTVALAGCAAIAPKPPVVTEAPVRTSEVEVPRTNGAHGTVQQDGVSIKVTASRSCDVIERPTVLRTTRTEHENKSATIDWLMAGSAVAVGGLGVVTVVDASNVASSDKSSQNYNPIGSGGATALGIGAIVGGAALLAIPIADVFRANKVTVEKQEVTSDGSAIRTAVACAHQPYSKASVTAKVRFVAFTLGQTNESGQLSVDLDAVIDRAWVVPSSVKSVSVFVADSEVGTFNMAPLFRARETDAFPARAAATCSAPRGSHDCDTFKEFLKNYPDGNHAAEARQILDAARAKLQELADEETWRLAEADVHACMTKKLEDPADIDAACSPASDYAKSFPEGRHVQEAEAAVKKGAARAAALRNEIERRQAATELAARRAEAAAEAAERRKEAAKAAQAKSDCVRIIQSECQRIAYRIPYDICFRRKMEAQGQCEQN